ncbi:AraC family transcriptional regulator [Rhizobium sp. Root1203]|uniref:AraC family transcriptional regulator n=1 Tax=Rhizobium sp. Root1203 TaxID=1736427 RepID=UPI00070A37DE|nr:AraC family transcriptional regulator [Rhizobium sp. Root1203]KQV17452.1 AraC family transcriptional regulator [Rhizobium sp. Root1203]
MDALTDVIRLLRPKTVLLGRMSGSGGWGVQVPEQPGPTFYFVTEGRCWFQAEGAGVRELKEGDYILSARPTTDTFSSRPGAETVLSDEAFKALHSVEGEVRVGDPETGTTTRILGGLIQCDAANADLLIGLLPRIVYVPASEQSGARLRALVSIIGEEADDTRPGRDAVLCRLIEVMLIETLRREAAAWSPNVGLLGGLAHPQLAQALTHIHADVTRGWTVGELARRVGMSRSVFARRFSEAVGVAPVEYLLSWRMALAKDALLSGRGSLEEIAGAVGYRSASAFSTAFSHRVGCPPSEYASVLQSARTTA